MPEPELRVKCEACAGTGRDPAGCNCSNPGPQWGHEPDCGACEQCWDAETRRSTGWRRVPDGAVERMRRYHEANPEPVGVGNWRAWLDGMLRAAVGGEGQ